MLPVSLTSGQEPLVQPASARSLAATLNMYASPTKGQTPEQSDTDEAVCYKFAVTDPGVDP